MPSIFTKDPNEVLEYKFDWAARTNQSNTSLTDYLQTGETIVSTTVTAETGITKDSDSITDTNTSVTVWLSGGTANEDYTVTCQITTSGGRTAERNMTILCRER